MNEKYDLIVLTTTGNGVIAEDLLGSVFKMLNPGGLTLYSCVEVQSIHAHLEPLGRLGFQRLHVEQLSDNEQSKSMPHIFAGFAASILAE